MSPTYESSQTVFLANSAGRFAKGFSNHPTAAAVPAVVFVSMLLLSVVQICRRKAWFFWSFTAALTLEATGFGALAYLSQHETNHLVYLLSMGFLTLAPSLLALSTFTAHGRITASTFYFPNKSNYRTLWLPEHMIASIFSAVQVLAIMFFTFAMLALAALHSPAPIRGPEDALARLSYETQALGFLRIGFVIQLFCLGLFIIVANGSSVADYIHGQTKTVYWAVNWVAFFNLITTSWKVLDFISLDPESLDILSSGLGPLLIDALPLVVAFSIFFKFHPGKIQQDRITLELERGLRRYDFTTYEISEKC